MEKINDYLKTIEIEIKMFDNSKIKKGQRIYYAERRGYSDSCFDDWSNCYDSGYGTVVDVCEEYITIQYCGDACCREVDLEPEDLTSGFYKLEFLE